MRYKPISVSAFIDTLPDSHFVCDLFIITGPDELSDRFARSLSAEKRKLIFIT